MAGRRRATYICGDVLVTRPDTTSGCMLRAQHTPEPAGYTAWFVWAAKMARTHIQTRCAACGLFRVWLPKPAAAAGAAP